jgi:hypothetical protein
MPPSEVSTSKTKSTVFLAEPSRIPELDEWIADYTGRGERFTFDETQVLMSLWQEGEDVRLREDKRFRQVPFSLQGREAQWYLAMHTLANQHLYELLLDELWDGCDLYRCLEDCDKDKENVYHVFCPTDTHFHLFKDEPGIYCISLREETAHVTLTTEQRTILDQLAPQLIKTIMNEGNAVCTTMHLLETLRQTSSASDALQDIRPDLLDNWLLHQSEWVRVGRDSWLPKSKIPDIPVKHRYAVSPVFSPSEGPKEHLPQLVKENALTREALQVIEEITESDEVLEDQKQVRWQIALRTCHINEATIPVPKQARVFYPHALKLADVVAIPGLWFTDGSDITVWLDRKKHQLFGPDLEEQFACIEAGTILDVQWSISGLVLYTSDIDTRVAEEEIRLIDLTSLSQQRSQALESYRTSLRLILSESDTPLHFRDLYEQLCMRQQHKPNSSTIRTILSSSPEFVFDEAEKKWRLNTTTNPEVGAKLLRSSTVLAKQIKDSGNEAQQESLSLREMIDRNRRQLSALRALYLPDQTVGAP